MRLINVALTSVIMTTDKVTSVVYMVMVGVGHNENVVVNESDRLESLYLFKSVLLTIGYNVQGRR